MKKSLNIQLLFMVLLLLINSVATATNTGTIDFKTPAKRAGKITVKIYYVDQDGDTHVCEKQSATIPRDSSAAFKANLIKDLINTGCNNQGITAEVQAGNSGAIDISGDNDPEGGLAIVTEIDIVDKTNQDIEVTPDQFDDDKGDEVAFHVNGFGEQEALAMISIPEYGVQVQMPIMGMPGDQLVMLLAQELNLQFSLLPGISPFFAFAEPFGPGAGSLHILSAAEDYSVFSSFGGDSGYEWEIKMRSLQLSGQMTPFLPVPPDHPFPERFPNAQISNFVMLPGVIDIFGITPPLTLDPTNEYLYGRDYFAFQLGPDLMGLCFNRPGDYWVEGIFGDGETFVDFFTYFEDMCNPPGCCGATKRESEVNCGAPDIAILGTNTFNVDTWENAGTTQTATSIADAKQKICDKYDAGNPKVPITVGIKAHGSNGSVEIGGEELTEANLTDFVDGLKGKIKELRIFACNVGQDSAFICMLEQKLGCNVIASDGVMIHRQEGDGQTWWTRGKMVSWNPKSKIKFETPASVEGAIGARIVGETASGLSHELVIPGGAIHPVGTAPEVKADSLVKRINEKIFLDPFLRMEAEAVGSYVIIRTLDGDRLIKVEVYDATKQVIISLTNEMSGEFKTVEIPLTGMGSEGFATLSLDDYGIAASADMNGRTSEEIANDLIAGLTPLLPFPPQIMYMDLEVFDPLNVILRIQGFENIGQVTADFGGDNGLGADHGLGGFDLMLMPLPDPVNIPVEIISLELTSGMPVLHGILEVSALAPPLMLNLDHEFVYGRDYGVIQIDPDSYTFSFPRPGIFLADVINDVGEPIHYIFQVDVRTCTDINECCQPQGRAIEIPCGVPADNDSIDLVIKSSTLNLGYEPDWSNARTEVGASTIQEAKQAICDAYAAKGNQQISVAIDAHGNSGYFRIGNQKVDMKTLKSFVDGIKGKVSQLRLFSCKTGKDSKFICQLERLLGADVVSSTGSNWDTPPAKQDETGQHWYTDGNQVSWEPGNTVAILASCILDAPVDPETGWMIPRYYEQGVLPPLEPFTDFGFPLTYPSLTVIDSHMMLPTPGLPLLPIDWAYVQIVDATNSESVIASRPAVINQAGSLVDLDGAPLLTFDLALLPPLTTDSIQIRIRTKSTLTELSPIFSVDSFFDIAYSVDFEMRSGDLNFDNVVDAADRSEAWNFRNAVGYLPWDINFDGVVDAADRSVAWNMRNQVGQ